VAVAVVVIAMEEEEVQEVIETPTPLKRPVEMAQLKHL
jgi:hypothetical protein